MSEGPHDSSKLTVCRFLCVDSFGGHVWLTANICLCQRVDKITGNAEIA